MWYSCLEQELDRTLTNKWYAGETGAVISLGAFLFSLFLDLMGANLAAKDGFKVPVVVRFLCSLISL